MGLALTTSGRSGLDVFVRRNRFLLLSALFAAASLHFFVSVHYVGPKRQLSDALAQSNAFLERENKKLSVRSRIASAKSPSDPSVIEPTPASSLTRLVSLASAQEVHIGGVSLESDGNHFTTQISSDFRGLVRFLARLERLHISIARMELARAAESGASGLTSTLSIEVGPDALNGFGAPLLEVPELPSLVNPFNQRSCTASSEQPGAKATTPRLSAITELGGQAFVTLNGIDYAVGERVGAFRVAEIGSDSVRLTGEAEKFTASCLVLKLPALLSKADPNATPTP